MLQKKPHRFVVAVLGRHEKGSGAVVGRRVRVGAVIKQHLHDLVQLAFCGQKQGRRPVGGPVFRIRPIPKKDADRLRKTVLGGDEQRRIPRLVPRVDVGVVFEKETERFVAPCIGRP